MFSLIMYVQRVLWQGSLRQKLQIGPWHVVENNLSAAGVEVAMQMSLPLVKANKLFSSCSAGFTANLSVMLREVSMASDEVLFRANDVCNELFIIASGYINLLGPVSDGEDAVRFSSLTSKQCVCEAASACLRLNTEDRMTRVQFTIISTLSKLTCTVGGDLQRVSSGQLAG